MSESQQATVVRRFYEAFNAQQLDALLETLDPQVELQTSRGLRRGLAEAREWGMKNPTGSLDQRIVVEELRERHNHVVALVRQQWWWREANELAEENEIAALFTFERGRIVRWQPFTERKEALRVAGIAGA